MRSEDLDGFREELEEVLQFDDSLNQAQELRERAHRLIDDCYQEILEQWRSRHETNGN